MSTEPQPTDEELFQYLAGEVSRERAAELDRWGASAPARARLLELRALTETLERLPETTTDLVPAIDAALDVRRRRRTFTFAATLAAAAALVLFVQLRPQPDSRIKGSPSTANSWAGVELYRLTPSGTPARLVESMAPTDGVLVAYTNGGGAPFSHLMVFGVSSSGSVHWYYPAWLDPKTDPASVAIVPTNTALELPDKVAHDLPRGRFVIHALFSRRPLLVSEVERLLTSAPGTLPLADTSEQLVTLEVK